MPITTTQSFDQNRVRWNGSGSAVSGSTPFGWYDNETSFQADAPKAADWAARRLGYPITDVELIDVNFYACFEEAITEYSYQVNSFNIRQNMMLASGLSTQTSLTGVNIQGTGLPFLISLSQGYGTEVGVGGTVDWKRGKIMVSSSVQTYNLQTLWADQFESGSRIEVKRIFHGPPPAIARIYDPFSMTGMSYSNILSEMGFAGYSPALQFLMCPIFEDLQRTQAIEFNDTVRKSGYSFELVNNKLKIFPIPTYNHELYFDYIVSADRNAPSYYNPGSVVTTASLVSDYSNVPYNIIPYQTINQPGKRWIYKYYLALCKELLGSVRQKYQTIPIPGSEVSLDGGELRSEAANEKSELVEKLREDLEESSRTRQMEKKAAETQQMQDMLKYVPLAIYIG